jgi:hypothetical protein
MLIASGLTLLTASLWAIVGGVLAVVDVRAGRSTAYISTLVVHYAVGYTDLDHLIPAFAGLGLYCSGWDYRIRTCVHGGRTRSALNGVGVRVCSVGGSAVSLPPALPVLLPPRMTPPSRIAFPRHLEDHSWTACTTAPAAPGCCPPSPF